MLASGLPRTLVLLFSLSIVSSLNCHAERALSVAAVFGDHAVLQRGVQVPIWGTADTGSQIEVDFAGQQQTAVADKGGHWTAWLEAMKESARGRDLVVRCAEHSLTFKNVVVGEVWLASGQSNMQFSLRACARRLKNVQVAMEEQTRHNIRLLRIGPPDSYQFRELDRMNVRWQTDSPTTRPNQSAVAFFFARKLARDLAVPIGVIESSWGGKPIEGFIPEEEFASDAALRPIAALARENRLEELKQLKGGVIIRNTAGMPGRIFNSRIAPVAPYAVAGAIWYQGESNAGTGEDPRNYRIKMEALIRGWRKTFKQPRMPFYFVQLPAFRDESFGWVRLREEQRLSLTVPHTGMAVTIDLRDTDIHPANKIDVGERLAHWPLARQYGKREIVPGGPLFKSARIDGTTVRVSFDHLGGGLMIARKEGLTPPRETPATALEHFEIAAADGTWHPAQAEIESQEVVIRANAVPKPVAVRYACRGAPANPNLYNRAGLPASPFCSRLEFLPWAPPGKNSSPEK
jgi:sialate O-acetylesterase